MPLPPKVRGSSVASETRKGWIVGRSKQALEMICQHPLCSASTRAAFSKHQCQQRATTWVSQTHSSANHRPTHADVARERRGIAPTRHNRGASARPLQGRQCNNQHHHIWPTKSHQNVNSSRGVTDPLLRYPPADAATHVEVRLGRVKEGG